MFYPAAGVVIDRYARRAMPVRAGLMVAMLLLCQGGSRMRGSTRMSISKLTVLKNVYI
jgi:hypothetical protein